MKYQVFITGSTGIVGKGVLLECLDDNSISQVILLNRSQSGMNHPKLREVLLKDFCEVSTVRASLGKPDACFELIDKAYYLNHYYFVSLLTFLLIFLPVQGEWSVDGRIGWRPSQPSVPTWMLWLVRAQLGLVYFFAGVAKLNPDWLLAAQPLTIWLHARTSTQLLGPLFDTAWMPYLFSWAGMLFDLTVPFWLSWRKSCGVAYLAVMVFHGLTGLLFNIGMFPWIMIACTLVFFDWKFLARRRSGDVRSS